MAKTRFAELEYEKHGADLWRIVDVTDPRRPAAVGPQYKTKAELLADLERFAAVFGATGAGCAREIAGQLVSKLNGIKVTRVHRTIFVPLPRELWVPIEGGCQCGFCAQTNAEGDKVAGPAFWDTLAISTQELDRHTWTVHAPELHK